MKHHAKSPIPRRTRTSGLLEHLEPRLMLSAVPVVSYNTAPDALTTATPILGVPWTPPPPSPNPLQPVTHDGLTAQGLRLNLDHRELFTGKLASFTDSTTGLAATAYAATIDWADGATTAATVQANGQGGFDVLASHAYLWGWYDANVHITAGTRTADVHSKIYVVPPPVAGIGFPLTLRAGETFTGTVGDFAGLDTALLDRYRVDINWGDTSSAGQFVTAPDGIVHIVGTHTYSKGGVYNITVNVSEKVALYPLTGANTANNFYYAPFWLPASPAIATTHADVAPGEVEGGPQPYMGWNTVHEGLTSTAQLAQYRILKPGATLADYRAIATVDGQPQDAFLVQGINAGEFIVCTNILATDTRARHVTFRLVRADTGTQVALANITVFATPMVPVSSVTPQARAGGSFDGSVGWLSVGDHDPNVSSDFAIVVHWADGLDTAGRLVSVGDRSYSIYTTRTFPANATLSAAVSLSVIETRTISHPDAPPTVSTLTYAPGSTPFTLLPALVDGCALAPPYFSNISVTAATDWDVVVGPLTLATPATPASLNPSIHWADGAASTVILQPTALSLDGLPQYTVIARRSFSSSGHFAGILDVTFNGTGRSLAFSIDVVASNAPWAVGTQDHPLSVRAGEPATITLARFAFHDSVPGLSTLAATISWGDGSTSTGTLVAVPGGVEVVGTHTYSSHAAGPNASTTFYPFVALTDGTHSAQTSPSLYLTRDPSLPYLTPQSTPAYYQRETFTAGIATFTAPESLSADDFTATLDFGDGRTAQARITATSPGHFAVSVTARYDASGVYAAQLALHGPTGDDDCTIYFTITHNPIVITPGQPTIDGVTISGTIATFTDADGPSADPDRERIYHEAIIDWGDGTTSAGIIQPDANNTFRVRGSHTYTANGDFQMRLVVRRIDRTLPGTWTDTIYDLSGGLHTLAFDGVLCTASNSGTASLTALGGMTSQDFVSTIGLVRIRGLSSTPTTPGHPTTPEPIVTPEPTVTPEPQRIAPLTNHLPTAAPSASALVPSLADLALGMSATGLVHGQTETTEPWVPGLGDPATFTGEFTGALTPTDQLPPEPTNGTQDYEEAAPAPATQPARRSAVTAASSTDAFAPQAAPRIILTSYAPSFALPERLTFDPPAARALPANQPAATPTGLAKPAAASAATPYRAVALAFVPLVLGLHRAHSLATRTRHPKNPGHPIA